MGKVLTIDTGGTKTRIVQFSEISDIASAFDAPVLYKIEFPTPYDHDEYITKVATAIHDNFSELSDDTTLVLGIRGLVKDGGVTDPKLGWDQFPIVERLWEATDKRVMIENDAKLGALSAFGADFHGRGLYLTIGTGVGSALVIDNKLSRDMEHTEVGHMLLPSDNSYTAWQNMVSGASICEKYGRRSNEIPAGDPIWREYAENLGTGILMILPIFYPDIITIGGSIANEFDRYGNVLQEFIQEHTEPQLRNVQIIAAHDPVHTVNRGGLIFYYEKVRS